MIPRSRVGPQCGRESCLIFTLEIIENNILKDSFRKILENCSFCESIHELCTRFLLIKIVIFWDIVEERLIFT